MAEVRYLINNFDFRDMQVYVSASSGMLDRPKLKPLQKMDWPDYHGEVVDFKNMRYEAREITLNCFMTAENKLDFTWKLSEFLNIVSGRYSGVEDTQRLTIIIDPDYPLVYEVYIDSAITINKRWNDDLMVGTFTLKFREPEPMKTVIKSTSRDIYINCHSQKSFNIYWGDGNKEEDLHGDVYINHRYPWDETFYAIITGVIEDVTYFSTNGMIIWNGL